MVAMINGQGVMGSKATPSNSPYRANLSKVVGSLMHGTYDSDAWRMSLKQIIGATVSSPPGFDSLPASRSIAYTAGGIAVLLSLNEDLTLSQRFFRARPDATPLAPLSSSVQSPSLRHATLATQKRYGTPLRDASTGPGLLATEWEDSPTSKTWTARERVKSASCVSLSADGRHLAVGEVSMRLQMVRLVG